MEVHGHFVTDLNGARISPKAIYLKISSVNIVHPKSLWDNFLFIGMMSIKMSPIEG